LVSTKSIQLLVNLCLPFLATLLVACDAGKRDDVQPLGPAILVVGVNVGDGQPLPTNGSIQIAFDRYLLPSTVNRQSFAILDGANKPLGADLVPLVQYDPVARTVTLSAPVQPWLTEGQPYKLVLGIPDGNADMGGVRAIDRATLSPAQTREFAFFVAPARPIPQEPAVKFCRDVLPLFAAKCSLSSCHGTGSSAASGLVLDTSAGVAATALNRVAQGSNRGSRSDLSRSIDRLFGFDMPLIDPGNPGNSWLMYKIELAASASSSNTGPQYTCANAGPAAATRFAYTPLAPNAQRSADNIERAILGNSILGREMPFPSLTAQSYESAPLTFDEREKVRIWIQSLPKDATIAECGGCGVVPGSVTKTP
jgi:hypothetical protein